MVIIEMIIAIWIVYRINSVKHYVCSEIGLDLADANGVKILKIYNTNTELINKAWCKKEHWLHSRIDGGPDRRYNTNYIIPDTYYIIVELRNGAYMLKSTDIVKIGKLKNKLINKGYLIESLGYGYYNIGEDEAVIRKITRVIISLLVLFWVFGYMNMIILK